MSLTTSTMLPLGNKAPAFALRDLGQVLVPLKDFVGAKAYLIAFICPHCPYVKHVEEKFVELAAEYQTKDVAVIAINSNDPQVSPEDDLSGMKQQAARVGFNFPYLQDHTQEVAKAYQAACTPDFYVFDSSLELVYRGQFDDTRPMQGQEPTGEDLKQALNAVLSEEEIEIEQQPSTGCNIKWAPGNEPDYFWDFWDFFEFFRRSFGFLGDHSSKKK